MCLSLCYLVLLMLALYMEVRLGLWNQDVEKDTRVCGLNKVDYMQPDEDFNWVALYRWYGYGSEFILIYAYIIKLYCVLIQPLTA